MNRVVGTLVFLVHLHCSDFSRFSIFFFSQAQKRK